MYANSGVFRLRLRNFTGIMSLARPYRPRDGHFRSNGRSSHGRMRSTAATAADYSWSHEFPSNSDLYTKNRGSSSGFSWELIVDRPKYDHVRTDEAPRSKRRKVLDFPLETLTYGNGLENHAGIRQHVPPLHANAYCSVPPVSNNKPAATRPDDGGAYTSTTLKRDRLKYEDDEEVGFMSRDEIERCSPSRKDGIDLLHETHLRHSYCAFLHHIGVLLDL